MSKKTQFVSFPDSSGRRFWIILVFTLVVQALVCPIPIAQCRGIGYAHAGTVPLSKTPVVLVHGLNSDPFSIWGFSDNGRRSPGSMFEYLVKSGYQPGVTLFALDYSVESDGDYVEISKKYLKTAIEDIRHETGSHKVDVVAHSMGGLVARYYIQSPDYAGDIRTLVMIGPPNHGSFGASMLRMISELLHVEAVRRETGYGSADPCINIVDTAKTFPKFKDSTSYVLERSLIYEHLYSDYILKEKLLKKPNDVDALGFGEWIRNAYPEIWEAAFLNAQNPPMLGQSYSVIDSEATAPTEEGKALTRAYYEILALNAGKNSFISKRTEDSGNTFAQAIKGILLSIGRDIIDPLLVKGAKEVLRTLALRLGLNPDSPAIKRLVEEWAAPTLARGAERLLSNFFLNRWNQRDLDLRTEKAGVTGRGWGDLPDVNEKYITFAGASLSAWEAVLPTVGQNDLAVEVESTMLPQMENDIYLLFKGITSSSHSALTRNSSVQKETLHALTEYIPIKATHFPTYTMSWWKFWSRAEFARMKVSLWKPAYARVSADKLRGKTGDLNIQLNGATLSSRQMAKGIRPWIWVYRKTADRGWLKSEVELDTANRAAIVIEDFGAGVDEVLIGMRLKSERPGVPASDDPQPIVSYTLRFTPKSTESGSQQVLPNIGDTGEDYFNHDDDGMLGYDEFHAQQLQEPINVIRRSKNTTSKKPMEVRHSRWVWDFGDGTVLEDTDPEQIVSKMEHFYLTEGVYTVTATAYDNYDREIRKMRWDVDVPIQSEDKIVSFIGESIVPPNVKIELKGPQKWIVGKPADFQVVVSVNEPKNAKRVEVSVDPGIRFQVIWAKPGWFDVSAAVTVRIWYEFSEGTFCATNVYLKTAEVEVLSSTVQE